MPRPVPQNAILAVGNSFTFGEEVNDDKSWPADLEVITGTPVINAASGAWGTDQIVMRAEVVIDIAHPKILIVDFYSQDVERAEYQVLFGGEKPYYTIEEGELVLHNVPVPQVTMAKEIGWLRSVLGYSYTVYWLVRHLGDQQWLYGPLTEYKRATSEGAGAPITCLLLKRLKERTEREGIRLLLVTQYAFQDFLRPEPPDIVAVLDCAHGLGIDALDTWAPLAEIRAGDPARFAALYNFHQGGASHMSVAGNSLIAGEIARRLKGDN